MDVAGFDSQDWVCIGRGPGMSVPIPGGGGVGVLPYSLGRGVPMGSQKFYPLLDQILQIL